MNMMEKEKIKKLEAQMANLYLDNQILKKTMNMILDRLDFIEGDIVSHEDEPIDDEVLMFPVQNRSKIVAEYDVLEVT